MNKQFVRLPSGIFIDVSRIISVTPVSNTGTATGAHVQVAESADPYSGTIQLNGRDAEVLCDFLSESSYLLGDNK